MSQSGEKTEKATAKKRRDARKEGQVRQSTEVTTAFCALVMFGLLYFIWESHTQRMMAIFSEFLGFHQIMRVTGGLSINELMGIIARVMLALLLTLLPILGTAMIAGVTINIIQIGFNFTTKPLGIKLSKISPIKGFKRMFSMKTLVDLLKSLMKIALLGYIAYSDYVVLLNNFPNFVGRDVYSTFIQIMTTAFLTALKMCLAMIFIAIADFLYTWWKYEKDLRMTKQEVKDEYKMMEGDPQIKGKIKQKQRQMSAMRMMSKVPEADVVITNPTHYAVALKYDDQISSAPLVIAKGQDYIARKIREVAQEYNVQIVEDAPLAQALYALCEVDEEIPADFYQAVADILVFVYRQKGKIKQ
jgi:flagellar biosynthetic protein FlhB